VVGEITYSVKTLIASSKSSQLGHSRKISMKDSHLKLITPNSEIRTVTPRPPKNADVRTREQFTAGEVEKLMEAARQNRHSHRDATIILMAYRHGLRAGELRDLRWDQVTSTAIYTAMAPSRLKDFWRE
jgi:integrase